jgi:hypothetical protein
MPTSKVILSGPLFNGQAANAAKDFTDSIQHELALIAQTWIKLDTDRMTKSGSDTGQAAEGVKLSGGNGQWVISGGISKGKYAWPWLEGTSKRNQSTGFKGYKTFSRTRARIRKQATPFAESRLQEYIGRMGGGET